MRQLIYQVDYAGHQISLHLRWIRPVLEHCKDTKYYDQDCSFLIAEYFEIPLQYQQCKENAMVKVMDRPNLKH